MNKLKIFLSILLIFLVSIGLVYMVHSKNNKTVNIENNINISSNDFIETNNDNTIKNEKENTILNDNNTTEETKQNVLKEESTKNEKFVEKKEQDNKNKTSNANTTEEKEQVTNIENKTSNVKPTEEKKPNKTSIDNEKTNTNKKEKNGSTKIIVIDPGHQTKGDSSKEPIGPGATETKAKVTTGATGVATKQTEAKLNLKVSLMLRTELEKRGYKVIMTRTKGDVNISNSKRADIANRAEADAFVRIHADSVDESSVVGMSTLCQTSKNKYNGNLAEESYKLSKKILDNMCKKTGAKNRGVTRTDNMSGINWAKVPVTIIEMGFLSNPKEDKLLSTQNYQEKITQGIADGIDEFLK